MLLNYIALNLEMVPKYFFACFDEMEARQKNDDFTAWSIGNEDIFASCFWADEFSGLPQSAEDPLALELHPAFDLGSLTKPLFLNILYRMHLKADYLETMKTPISKLIPTGGIYYKEIFEFFKQKEFSKLSLDSLFSHTSGAMNWFWMGSGLWLQKQTSHHSEKNIYYNLLDKNNLKYKENIVYNLNNKCLNSILPKNNNTVYSDINYFLLARIFEMYFSKNICWKNNLDSLNQIMSTQYMHASISNKLFDSFIPYYPYYSVYNSFDKGVSLAKFGSVFDTNANILSMLHGENKIVSGHAGYFGNVVDVEKSIAWLASHQRQCVSLFQSENRFCLGLDTPRAYDSHSGIRSWPLENDFVFGHLGYTGTSFWFSLDKKDFNKSKHHIILTNRTASRVKLGVEKCPRLLIITHKKENITKCFIVEQNSLLPIEIEEAKESMFEYSKMSYRVWNSQILRNYPNMLQTRINIARKLWDM